MSREKALAVLKAHENQVASVKKSLQFERWLVGGFDSQGLAQVYEISDTYDSNVPGCPSILTNVQLNVGDEVAVGRMSGIEVIFGKLDRKNGVITNVQLSYPTQTDGGLYVDHISNAQANQSSSDGPTTSTSVLSIATTGTLVLPAGTWQVHALGFVDLQHSAGGNAAMAVDIDGTTSGANVNTCPSTGFRTLKYRQNISVSGGRTITITVYFRSSAVGTTTASNPGIWMEADRTA